MTDRRFRLLSATLFLFIFVSLSTAQPPYELRPPAEFEPHEAMLIGWGYLGSYGSRADTMWARAVEEIREVADVYIVVPYSANQTPITNFLTGLGISMDNVYFMVTTTMVSVWVRDYGPSFAYKENGVRVVLEGGYSDNFPHHVAGLWGLEHYHVPLNLQGGNYMTDGGRYVTISEAPVGQEQLWQSTVRSYYDLPLHTLPKLQDEPCGHVDMYARFVAPGVVVMSEYADPYYNNNLDAAALELENRGYTVYRVPTPPVYNSRLPEDALADPSKLHLPPGSKAPPGDRWDVFQTYTNGIQCNGKYLMPVYDHEFDDDAEAIFQMALPDHEIVPILATQIILYGGALHCTSSDIAMPAPARPGNVTLSMSGSDAVLSWTGPPIGVTSYRVYKRINPLGFELDIDEYVAEVGGTNWTDENGLTDGAPVSYQIVSVNSNSVLSAFSEKIGGVEFTVDLNE
jgi:agmatine deiminase